MTAERETLAPNVRALLEERVDSVEALQVLLLVWRDPSRDWELPSIAGRLGLMPQLVEGVVRRLATHDVLSLREDRVRWHGNPALDEAARDLAAAYDTQRLDVLEALNAQAMERARRWAVRRLELRQSKKYD